MVNGAKEDLENKVQRWEYVLPVQEFDSSKFQVYYNRMAELGIEISTLEEEAKDPECYQKLYSLALKLDEHIPELDMSNMTSDQFKKIIQNPEVLPNGYFIAKDGEKYVGASFVVKDRSLTIKDRPDLHQSMTATLEEYRGKGIAVALKLKTIEFAKEYGAEFIKTVNDSNNKGIIALNEKLGFKRQET